MRALKGELSRVRCNMKWNMKSSRDRLKKQIIFTIACYLKRKSSREKFKNCIILLIKWNLKGIFEITTMSMVQTIIIIGILDLGIMGAIICLLDSKMETEITMVTIIITKVIIRIIGITMVTIIITKVIIKTIGITTVIIIITKVIIRTIGITKVIIRMVIRIIKAIIIMVSETTKIMESGDSKAMTILIIKGSNKDVITKIGP
jgi:hypothetical protein